jgi:threonine synthase
MKLGLPIDQFVASTNSNDTIPRYLNTKNYNPKKTIPTISNAMDVSNPSNFIRIEEIFQDFNELKNCFSSYSFNDDKTLKAVKSVYKNSNYILDPHGAVGYLGLKKFLTNNSDFIGIFLETAHPIKFSNHIENELDLKLKIPQSISKIISRKKRYIDIENYSNFKRKILNMGLIK